MTNQSLKITLSATSILSQELKRLLESQIVRKETSIELTLEPRASTLRAIDPTVLVAIVSVTGAALGSLVSGLLQVAQTSRQGKIILQGKDGAQLEIPSNTPLEKVDKLIEKLRMMDIKHIHLAR